MLLKVVDSRINIDKKYFIAKKLNIRTIQIKLLKPF